jgi:hypothetical protein
MINTRTIKHQLKPTLHPLQTLLTTMKRNTTTTLVKRQNPNMVPIHPKENTISKKSMKISSKSPILVEDNTTGKKQLNLQFFSRKLNQRVFMSKNLLHHTQRALSLLPKSKIIFRNTFRLQTLKKVRNLTVK